MSSHTMRILSCSALSVLILAIAFEAAVALPFEMTAREREVLEEFYNSTNGDTWTGSKWDLNVVNPCDFSTLWTGIFCLNGHLSTINLNGKNLTGTLPASLGELSWLTTFNIYDNSVGGTLPSSMRLMSSLNTLDLSANQFSGFLPPNANNWTALTDLLLNGNSMEGAFPEEFFALPAMKKINLAGNKFTGTVPVSLNTLNKLTEFNLNGNNFHGVFPSGIGNATSLMTFDVGSNSFEGTLPASLGNATNLRTLNVTGNKFTGEVPSSYGSFKFNIRSILMANNNLTGPIPSELGNLGTLVNLDLSNNMLNGSIPASAENLTSVEVINFSYNNLSGDISPAVWKPAKLRELYLQGNSIEGTFASFLGLSVLPPELIRVDLSQNNIGWSADFFKVSFGSFPQLGMLNVSHNHLYGAMTDLCPSIPCGFYKRLFSLDLSHNNISGPLSNELWGAVARDYVLQTVDLSNNDLSGNIPITYSNLPNLDVRDNPNLAWSGSLPSFLQVQLPELVNHNLTYNYYCPGVKRRDGGIFGAVEISPSYYDDQLCQCVDGYVGVSKVCAKCHPLADCSGNRIPSGFWALPDPLNIREMIQCHNKKACSGYQYSSVSSSTSGSSTTNASSSTGCAPEYRGRECTECAPDHYYRDYVCRPCSDYNPPFAVAIVVIVTAITIVAPKLARRGEEAFSRAAEAAVSALLLIQVSMWWVAILVVFFSLVTIMMGNRRNVTVFRIIFSFAQLAGALYGSSSLDYAPESFDAANFFAFGFECTGSAPSAIASIELWFLLPLVISGAFGFAGILARSDRPRRIILCGWLMTLNIMYFPLAYRTLSVFNCVESVEGEYMDAYPWVSCETSDYNSLKGEARASVIVYLLGIPLLSYGILHRYRKKAKATHEQGPSEEAVGFLFTGYRKGWQQKTENVLFLQRALLAAAAAAIPSTASAKASAITFIIAAAIAFQFYVRPYQKFKHNLMQEGALFILLVSYSAFSSTTNPSDTESHNKIQGIVLILAIAFVAGVFAYQIIRATSFPVQPPEEESEIGVELPVQRLSTTKTSLRENEGAANEDEV